MAVEDLCHLDPVSEEGRVMKGARWIGFVWWCDDECECSRPVICPRHRLGGEDTYNSIWQGTFRSMGCWDKGDLGPYNELNRVAGQMRRIWREAYHAIEWPWDRSAKANVS
jgi:hypothetical protein